MNSIQNKKFTIIEQAMRIALRAHEGQTRKDDGSPYVIHPLMVSMILKKHTFSDSVIAGAIAHDILEDTNVSEGELRELLGDEVVAIVKGVSEDKELPWEKRKENYREMVRNASVEVKAVSLADKIHNLESLLAAYDVIGPKIWKKFNRGRDKKLWFEVEMLKMFKETWKHPLVEEYEVLVERMKKTE